MHLRLFRGVLAFAGLLALVCGLAGADPTFLGSTGLIRIPTADAVPVGNVDAQYHFIDRANELNSYGANFGLAGAFEVGATVVDPENVGSETLVNAKYTYVLTQEAEGYAGAAGYGTPGYGQAFAESPIRIALGVFDATDRFDRAYYIAASKTFVLRTGTLRDKLFPITAHVGYVNANNNTLSPDGVFFAGDADITPEAKVIVEFDGDDLNWGVRYKAGKGLSVDAASLDGDVGAGINYTSAF